jgi:hypothetical protein
MRKLIRLIVLVGTTILMLMPVQPLQPVQRVQAVPGYEVHYTVWYNPDVGPVVFTIAGEWTSSCDGSWIGWGWEPGHEWSYTDVTYGAACSAPPEPSYP